MEKKRVGTHADLVRELEKDPEYVKADRKLKPYYQLTVPVLKLRIKPLSFLWILLEPVLVPVLYTLSRLSNDN